MTVLIVANLLSGKNAYMLKLQGTYIVMQCNLAIVITLPTMNASPYDHTHGDLSLSLSALASAFGGELFFPLSTVLYVTCFLFRGNKSNRQIEYKKAVNKRLQPTKERRSTKKDAKAPWYGDLFHDGQRG